MLRRGGAGDIVDAIENSVDAQRVAYVVLDEAEVRMVQQRSDVPDRSRQQTIHADHPVSALQERVAKMRSDEASATRHENATGLATAAFVGDRWNVHVR